MSYVLQESEGAGGKVGVGSNIAQNHSSSKSYLVIICQVESVAHSVRTLFQISLPAYRKSYVVIICFNSYEKLTKIKIRSSRFKHCSESLV